MFSWIFIENSVPYIVKRHKFGNNGHRFGNNGHKFGNNGHRFGLKDTNSASLFDEKDTNNILIECLILAKLMLMSKHPAPTGNIWHPSEDNPATLPVPLPVIIVKVEGPFTERDRKLWTFLLHAVWDELGIKPIHELSVAKINQIFRNLGGEHDNKWIWESAKRLARTMVEWEQTEEDTRYLGISSLFAAVITKETKTSGILRFHFPPLLIPIIKEPGRFARLRVHFLIGLSGKYAVSLYELLESVANKINPVLNVSIESLRQWLKVPEGKLTRWVHFSQRVLQPAISQINATPLGSGFTVEMKPVKQGRAVQRVRFTVTKVNARLEFEKQLCEAGKEPENFSLLEEIRLSPLDYERARAAAPRWDIYELERQWREWIATKPKPTHPGAAFVAFCRKKAAKSPP